MRTSRVRCDDGGTREITYGRDLAIRLFCTECMQWVCSEVKQCSAPLCPLYPFRGATHKTYHGENSTETETYPDKAGPTPVEDGEDEA